MAVPIESDELQVAWHALTGQDLAEGWTSIGLGAAGARFRGGASYPGGYETLLVGFNDVSIPRRQELPAGAGFSVVKVDDPLGQGFTRWIGITRRGGGAIDLFAQMCGDVIASVSANPGRNESWLLHLTLARIRAWQDFMRRPATGVLKPEEELGLAGELVILENILELGVDAYRATAAWQGPSGSTQDFLTDSHGLEVKTSLAVNGFPAEISSLDQLDDTQGRLVLLAAVRFCLQADGRRLPELVGDLRTMLASSPPAFAHLETSLLQAGYFDAVASDYVRTFSLVNIRVFEPREGFPRLIRSEVAREIRSATYELDLDLVQSPATTLAAALSHHGVF